MLSCKDATRLASEQLDRKLGLRERAALRAHLLMCAGCARFERQLQFMRRMMGRYRREHGSEDAPD
jgi:hypothetical protein